MATRRLFSKKVLYDDHFSTLTSTAKALYIYMNMEADDDGVIGCMRQVLRYAGANRKSLDMLVDRGLVIELSNGICIISHWHIHNNIPKDRYTPSVYQKELEYVSLTSAGIYVIRYAHQ